MWLLIPFHSRSHIAYSIPGKATPSGPIPKTIPDKDEPTPLAPDGEKACESCRATTSQRWYQWGSVHEQCRLCNLCYTYWRKYGGLKLPNKWGESLYESSRAV